MPLRGNCLVSFPLSFTEAPQVLPLKNLFFKSQILGNAEERRLPEGLNDTGVFFWFVFLDEQKNEQNN